MTLAFKITSDVTPEIDHPSEEKLISGTPEFTTWSLEETEDQFTGIWQSTPGKWYVSYDEWEYFNILEGHSVLTDADGNETQLRAGDRMVIRPGFSGTWEVLETTRKDYVIRIFA
ncbi:cupin domain-containing protein [Aliiroseovarius sp. S253]|uniref:cupin domain-containing protein n=1 Tax=Aliiroseovarius sp. S253 TaxID=3415133 RepID=UPI003C7E66EF